MALRVDSTVFFEHAEKLMRHSKLSAQDFMLKQGKLFMKDMVGLTPPGDETTRGLAAKRQGEKAIEADLAKVFLPVGANVREKDLEAIHQSQRNSRGRVGNKRLREVVREKDFWAYRRKVKRKVGTLAAGFNRASARLGYRPPAWIWRHPSLGAIKVGFHDKGIKIKIVNKVRFAGKVKDLERHAQRALNLRGQALRRQWKAYKHRLAQKSGFRRR